MESVEVGNGRWKVKIGEESERRVTAMVCRLRWEGMPARSRLAWRIVRLQRAPTLLCGLRWLAVPGNDVLCLPFASFYYYRACLYSMLLLINNSRQCLLISHCVPGTVLSAFLKYTHLTLLMTQSNRYL